MASRFNPSKADAHWQEVRDETGGMRLLHGRPVSLVA